MPHLVVLYSGNLEKKVAIQPLCSLLAQAMKMAATEQGNQIFPTGGIRVLAFASTHFAIADEAAEYGFVYLNLRMARGRSDAIHQTIGTNLSAICEQYFANVQKEMPIGVTFQIDEGLEVFDAKHSSLHPLFSRPTAP